MINENGRYVRISDRQWEALNPPARTHRCPGLPNWVYSNKKCPGADKWTHDDGSFFELLPNGQWAFNKAEESELDWKTHGKPTYSRPEYSQYRTSRAATAPASGEVRTTSSTGGQKGVKPQRYSLIPPAALNAIAMHFGKGAEKYDDHQWRKGYEWSKSFDAMMRHAWAFWEGQDDDPETGTPHLAAVVFHAMVLLTFVDEHPDFDDRPSRISEPRTSE
ncbi:dATP/dGTP diphosphohydrolase domain-containing protein [Nocardia sp. NPDC057440]|uniref:dATP/dGTP diphosphohydrolase domain-containing protein n=1 Tax=Nocardia sp. NPDC057440 TaxID=3346134 RepID=UPI00366E0BB8